MLRAGQYKYEFDVEGHESASALTLADRPFVTNSVAGSLNGASSPSAAASSFRDRGVSLLGRGQWRGRQWRYAVGGFQGSGRASDNNSSPALVAGLGVSPLRGFEVNLGWLSADNRDPGQVGDDGYRAWTLGADYARGALGVRGEYYSARRKLTAGPERLHGHYVRVAWRALPDLELFVRQQSLSDPRVTAGAEAVQSVDLGAKWFLARKGRSGGTSLGVNLLLRGSEAASLAGLTLLNDARGAALTRGASLGAVFVTRLQVQF